MYGFGNKDAEPFGRNCLLARRLVERGVRFVQLYHGTKSKWDSHSKMEENHGRQCRQSDQPVAALLKDLKARGLLDETLVDLGRRIRPNSHERKRRRAATTIPPASRCGWPAAA